MLRRVSSDLDYERASPFLALFCELLFAFFGLDQHVIRIADFLFPSLSDFSVAAPIVQLKLVQVFKKFLVKFGLQFKSKARELLCRFRFEQTGLLESLKVLDDPSKGYVEAGESFVNVSLLGNINCSHGSPFLEGDLWLGLRRCL